MNSHYAIRNNAANIVMKRISCFMDYVVERFNVALNNLKKNSFAIVSLFPMQWMGRM